MRALKCDDVAQDHFKIVDNRTEAGIREVPIHSKTKRTVKRLTETSKIGYLVTGLSANK